jgi:glycosyltransferase involved in cell wall biosynthesis
MVYLKNTIMETAISTDLETEMPVKPYFEDYLSSPFIDRRVSDRRVSDRRVSETRVSATRVSGRRMSDRIGFNNIDKKKLTILIPCYNEEKGIGKVIDGVPYEKLAHLGYQTDIIVINNNSVDQTIKIATEKGAKVISEKKQGKGNAIKTGFKNISEDTDYVVMLDGDNTYKSKEITRLLEPLENDFCDIVIGSRLEGRLSGDSLSLSHRLANWFFTFLVRRFYFVNTTDICSGYFAWKKKAIDDLSPHIKSDGFAIEAEMITKMARLGYKIFSVPITYDRREGNSKLSPYLDGLKITWMLLKNLVWKPEKKTIVNLPEEEAIQNLPLFREYKNSQCNI